MPKTLIAPDVYAATFPMVCPICKAKEGMPYRASTRPNFVDVQMRCGACHHDWQIEMAQTAPVFRPKEDRRESHRDVSVS